MTHNPLGPGLIWPIASARRSDDRSPSRARQIRCRIGNSLPLVENSDA
jgi:hypothetical protein